MLPWQWFSSKGSTPQVEPSVVDAQAAHAAESTPTTDPIDLESATDQKETTGTNETNETNGSNEIKRSNEISEESETSSILSLTLEEQLAAARDRMKRSSMVAEALPSDVERRRVSMTEQRSKRLTVSGAPSSSDKESGSKRRHSKRNSVEARPGAPKRSSSVKNVLNAYYKIFGGKPPSKSPAAEQPLEEADRLRKLVRRYEKQLEEASNTIMLQDKVLAKWESKAKILNSDDSAPESSSRGLDLKGTHFESSASEPVNRLANIQESSREMLADFVLVEEGGKQPERESVQGNPSSTAEVLRLTKELQAAQAAVERLTKELEAAQTTVEEQTSQHAQLQQESSRSLDAENQSRQELENEVQKTRSELEGVKVAHAETLTFLETVKRTLSETQASHLETVSTLRETKTKLSETSQLVSLHETSLSDKDAERDALMAGHESTLSQANQDLETAREKITYLETQVGAISKEYQDAKTALEAANVDLETAKEGVSNVALERDAAKADFDKMSADYEAKSKEHQEISSALDSARSEIDEHKTITESAKTEVAALQEQLSSLQKELEDTKVSHDSATTRIAELVAAAELHGSMKEDVEQSKAENEKLKQEVDRHTASRAELDEQLRSLQSEVDNHVSSKAELQRELDDHLNSKAALQTELNSHIASNAELQKALDDHANAKSVLQAELDDHVASKSSLQKELEEHVSSSSALQKQLDDHATTQASIEKQLEQLPVVQAELEAAQTKISELQSGSDDQVRALQADIDAHVKSKADLQAELEHLSNLKSEHEVALTKVAELEAASGDHQSQLETANARIAELMKDAENHAVVQTEYTSALSQLAETKQQVDAHAARIDELNREIEDHAAVKADLKSAHGRVADLTKAVDAHGPIKAELDLHKEQVATLSKAAEEHDLTKAELESHREQVATLSKAVEEQEAVRAELDSYRKQIATLTKTAEEYEVAKKELDSHREQVATLSKAAEQHAALQADLQTHQEKVSSLSKALEEHSVVKADLESHQEKVASLSRELEEHSAVKADLQIHQAKVAELSKAVEDHAAVKADLETHRLHVAELTKAADGHESVKTELDAARARLADLEKDVETHKADKGSISEQLAVAETALTAATQSHKELSSKAKDAEQRLLVAEEALRTSKEDHEANLATLTEKVGDIDQLQEHNILLRQELKASLDSERAMKLAVQDLEEKLKAAESKAGGRAVTKQDSESEKSHLSGAAAIALGGAGAVGLAKALDADADGDEAVGEKKPELVDQKSEDVKEEKMAPAAKEEAQPAEHGAEDSEDPLPAATIEVAKPATTPESAQEENMSVPESEEHLAATTPASSAVGPIEMETSKGAKDVPAVDNPRDLTLVDSQEIDTATPTAPLAGESSSSLVPSIQREQHSASDAETDSYLPGSAIAAGAMGLAGVGALGLSNANAVAKEHDDSERDLPATKDMLTEEAESVLPETAVEDSLVVRDDDSASETPKEMVREEGIDVSKELSGEESPQTTALHHSIPSLEPVTLDDLMAHTAITDASEIQTPLSPVSSTWSKRKSVRWEDIESAKSSPAEEKHEMSVGLGSPWLLDGEKDGFFSAEPANALPRDEPEIVALETTEPVAVKFEDAKINQHEPESAARAGIVEFDNSFEEAAEPTAISGKEFYEPNDTKSGTVVPETQHAENSALEPTDQETGDSTSIQQHVETLDAPEASEPVVIKQGVSTSTVGDEEVSKESKDESDPLDQSTAIHIASPTNVPEIPKSGPERRSATLTQDRSPAPVEESVFDKVFHEPQEVSTNSKHLEIDHLPIIEPVSKTHEPSTGRIGVHAEPSAERSDKVHEHGAASDVHAIVPALFSGETEDVEATEKTPDFVASQEEDSDGEPSEENVDKNESGQQSFVPKGEVEGEKPQKKRKKGKGKAQKGQSNPEAPIANSREIEHSTGSDSKEDGPAAKRQEGFEESAIKEASSNSSAATIINEPGDDNTDTIAMNSNLPLTVAKADTNGGLQHIFVSQEGEKEPVDYDEREKPKTEELTTVSKDDEKRGKKEMTSNEDDESSILADRAAHLLGNIKEAI